MKVKLTYFLSFLLFISACTAASNGPKTVREPDSGEPEYPSNPEVKK